MLKIKIYYKVLQISNLRNIISIDYCYILYLVQQIIKIYYKRYLLKLRDLSINAKYKNLL